MQIVLILLANLFLISVLNPSQKEPAYTVGFPAKAYPGTSDMKISRAELASDPSEYSWQDVINSEHFSIHYNTTGANATTHTYAQNINKSLNYSWTVEVAVLGFRPPPDPHINVYLFDIIDSPGEDVFGVTIPDYDILLGWHAKYISFDIDLSQTINPGLTNVTCAHEFFHTIQYSYYPRPPTDPVEKDWIAEGMAEWVETKVYPNYTGYGSYVGEVNYFMDNPDTHITNLNYSGVLFWTFLEEHYGGIETIEGILQQTTLRTGIDAVNATLNLNGSTFHEVFIEWTFANYLKDSYYSKGYLFNPIKRENYPYVGIEKVYSSEKVSDWAADYFEVNSSVIYLPILFAGEVSHNVTLILFEHGIVMPSFLELNATYYGVFNLMQANNLDKVVIIVRSLGDETSNNVTDYSLKYLGSSYELDEPKQITSSTTKLAVTKASGTQLSSTKPTAVVKKSSLQTSSTVTIVTVNDSSAQSCSPRTTAVVSKSSSQNSSETPTNVRLIGDVNGDGTVDVLDLEALRKAYGTMPGRPNWNSNCDLNSDNKVDFIDLYCLSKNYGKTAP